MVYIKNLIQNIFINNTPLFVHKKDHSLEWPLVSLEGVAYTSV